MDCSCFRQAIGRRSLSCVIAMILVPALWVAAAPAEPGAPAEPTAAPSGDKISFTQDVLDNGLRVIYAPLHQAPVVHVRVVYHVGSRDERPDRQGFAHMFEHMMFRGSAHVPPEEHMKLIGIVGGISNAFTSFDQTVYHDTLPADHLGMALYLEADRMASFKVSEQIYKTERKVVAEEWRMRQNRPYGNQYEDFLKTAFTSHSYRWTPIGNMDHLRAARVEELQDFFNTYYLPNNAVLVISGDFQLDSTRALVKKYFGWVPPGPAVHRDIPREPGQTAPRRADVAYPVPLPSVMIGYRLPPYSDPDHDALALLADVLGTGRSSRLERLLVEGTDPQAVNVSASQMTLEDAGLFIVSATAMQGRDPDAVERQLTQAVADVVEHGVTAGELEKAKTLERVGLVQGRETATLLATQLGDEALFGGDPNRVNTALARVNAVTVADVAAVAKKYLAPARATTLRVKPDPLGKEARAAATQAAMNTPVPPSAKPPKPRVVDFPRDYPDHAPFNDSHSPAHLAKGEETQINGVQVIVMPDPRLPLVTWSLTTRSGAYADPAGKEGLSALAGQMLLHGAGDLDAEAFSRDLESSGITLEVSDGGDFTRVSGSCITAQLDHAFKRFNQIIRAPALPATEFTKLREQTSNQLRLAQESPTVVAGNDLNAAIWGRDTVLGRSATPASVGSLTLDDVRAAYQRNLDPRDAILLIAGDVTVERGRELAKGLLDGWKASDQALPSIVYPVAKTFAARRIILVDRPGGKQATVRMAVPAYDIRVPEKFAGSIAGQILTAGIDSRLGRYVRAEKGLAYGVHGVFQPGRHGGAFVAGTDTAVESTADAIEAIFKVLGDMRNAEVTPAELLQSKSRVAGSMAMSMQTIQQQASFRVDGILNAYPIDYYDMYPAKVGEVTAEQVRDVMSRYVKDGQMTIVVVAPAEAVKAQLERLGTVEVVPMPSLRNGAATQPATPDLLKPAA